MASPVRLFLVRHGLSEANLDKSVNARLPDNRVNLAPEGHEQAYAAGKWLADHLPRFERTRILCSPYERTRQTSAGIERALTESAVEFDKREELALREISFGLFDGIPDEELSSVFPLEHAHYQKHVEFEGEFFAPMPSGESRVQVADRVKTVFGTILRDAWPDRPGRIRNFVIVSHGVTIRTFLMQWLHHPYEWYQAQKNPQNCSINLIESDGSQPYRHELVFAGFPNRKFTQQDKREEGETL